MEDLDNFRHRLRGLFESQKLAVLSTQSAGQPYASLVAFWAPDDLKSIYFATPNTTRKFANLAADSRVALLINNSSNQISDFHRAISVTAVGDGKEAVGSEKSRILEQYLSKHPYLQDFTSSPTTALVNVSVKSYYLVENFQHVMEMHIA